MGADFIKSPMNYTGGKYKLLKQIMPLFPQSIEGDFIDLFCGGCDVAINANAKRIIANDINKNIIDIYDIFKKESIEYILDYIQDVIETYSLSITNAEGYNQFREYYNRLDGKDPLDLFILICYSFNHQIRFNKDGKFNMPFGKDRSYFNDTLKKNLIAFHKAIHDKNIFFTNKNFVELNLSKVKPNDFIYCDPPYLITCATYNERDGWNEGLECSLYTMLDEANLHGAKFALSNVLYNKGKENEILRDWCRKYNVHHLNHTYSNCSYHAIDRDKTTTDEVLITNY